MESRPAVQVRVQFKSSGDSKLDAFVARVVDVMVRVPFYTLEPNAVSWVKRLAQATHALQPTTDRERVLSMVSGMSNALEVDHALPQCRTMAPEVFADIIALQEDVFNGNLMKLLTPAPAQQPTA
jgi:hypothetical protein